MILGSILGCGGIPNRMKLHIGTKTALSDHLIILEMRTGLAEPTILPISTIIDDIFSGSLRSIYNKYCTYMDIDVRSNFMIDLILAVSLSMKTSHPVWLFIVAPPSSGKTEALNLISKYKYVHPYTNVTRKFLLSGHKDAKGGYLLREVGKQGILVFPDFTTLINSNPQLKIEVFNQLRVIHDGSAGIATGIDSGNQPIWTGKVAFIACVTQTIDLLKARNNDLGERCLYYNYKPPKNIIPELYDNLKTGKSKSKAQMEIQRLVNSFLIAKSKVPLPELSSGIKNKLLAMADFICHMRAPVIRSRDDRDIIYVNRPEQPYRVLQELTNLYKCLLITNENEERSLRIIEVVSMSTVPVERLRLVNYVYKKSKALKNIRGILFQEIFDHFPLSSSKLRRDVEDLDAQDILSVKKIRGSKKDEIKIHPDFISKWESVK